MLHRLLLIILKVQFNKAETKVVLLKIRTSLMENQTHSDFFMAVNVGFIYVAM